MRPIFRVDGNRVTVSPDAAGPWDPTMQHGSPPASLVVWAAERIPAKAPMRIARLTIDLMRPVPLSELTLESELLRDGRKIQLVAIRLRAAGVVVAAATVLKVRQDAVPLPDDIADLPVDLPGPETSRSEPADFSSSPFVRGMSLRAARGRFGVKGPGAIWYRVDWPMVDGHQVSPAMRAAIAADFCNGTSPALDFDLYTFLNADLTVNMSREPVGDWILVDAESWIGPDGAGLAMARLGDTKGYFGRVVQSLVVERRQGSAWR
ncbi:thioesterase family protein [Bradyrhizobium sp. STM 3843]|uniref:thioesterase family protein n=1 Tax=Bradyrhizobium sp. STM 3843 TaxID=551947 RepID=UPI00055AD7DC|nr:thioesterase family protein [Bradyrhizobium sp. STM 3843]